MPLRRLLSVLSGLAAVFWSFSVLAQSSSQGLTNGNRLVYLDESDPFHPGLRFPKLTTPQWIGEPGVDAAVILAIDDMRDPARYEAYIRPILERLKQIDGRAPLSIMSLTIKLDDPQLQPWLKEGVTLEVHTLTHPEPLLAKTNFQAAADTYHGSIDLLNKILGNKPVAFRMPYCDSLNTPSPRFYAELFNSTSPAGQFLSIDSSVMNITTSADPELPRTITLQGNGKERFRKYIPFPSFVTIIENYPYPYVIGRLCWEFPAMVPSDWEAKNIHGTNNPVTVADWKAALDASVLKQGLFTFIFHPHGWIRPDQFVEFIDYATAKYGKRVKFLNFNEALVRINANLLAGQPLRAADGSDNGVRLIDLNNDGYLDVLIGNDQFHRTRVWEPKSRSWRETSLPISLIAKNGNREQSDAGVRFGIVGSDHRVAMLRRGNPGEANNFSFIFNGNNWAAQSELLGGLELNGQPVATALNGRDRGVRLRDLDNDGQCELIVGNEAQSAIFTWSDAAKSWTKAPFSLPAGTAIVDGEGKDAGLRFVDVNDDGYADVLFSNDRRVSLHLFRPKLDTRLGWAIGWSDEVISQERSAEEIIPRIARGGAHPNNGVWFHSGTMWVQNEETASLPDHVDRRSFKRLLTSDQPQALSPVQSLAAIKVHAGFKVELVAAEPMVQDPIAFDWGADGKLWVVEMGDYPQGTDGQGKSGGRMRFLEDTKGDGRYDKSTVFLDGLNFPNGLIPWRKGVIVSASPDVIYAQDTDGDGKADVVKKLFNGFIEGNQQHRANGFEYGLDNWLYGANGNSAGNVRALARLLPGALPMADRLNISGRDFRLQPDEGVIETVAGQTQYGRHRNDWGDWFGNENPTWLWHYYLPEHYLARNPNLAVKNTKRVLANYPDSTRAFPLSRTIQRFNDPGAANHVTSGNSATPYRDTLFGSEFANSVFISEPVHNLVHREVLERDGVSFKSARAKEEQNSEFLASSDNWFRPTMLKTGPDGALYIADMYRQVIEHPEWIPPEIQKRLDLRAGSDKGRIYRVYPEGATLRPIPRMDKLSPVELAAAMDSPNGWQRDTAQRLLVHAKDASAIPPLKKLLAAARPQTRLQSLATLQGLGAITPVELERALGDAHVAIRSFALQAAEPMLRPLSPKSALPADVKAVTELILRMVDDPELPVRYQLAFTLGEWQSVSAANALLQLADRDGSTPEMMTAVLSSSDIHAKEMLRLLLANSKQSKPPGPILGALLTSTGVARDSAAVAQALELIAQPRAGGFQSWQFRALAGLLDGLERQGRDLTKFVRSAAGSSTEIEPILRAAREIAGNAQAAPVERIGAIELLGRGASGNTNDLQVLGEALSPQSSMALQEASLAALNRSRAASVADVLLAKWRGFSPNLRMKAMNALGSRSEWINRLLAAIEAGRISAGEVTPGLQQRLVTSSDASIRARSEKLFSSTRSDRQTLVRQYASAVTGSGDSAHGAALFKQNCVACHKLHGEGNEIGPDLGPVAGKPTEVLLTAILDPNQAVESRYLSYNITTKSGRELSGIITGETTTSITVRNQGGTEEVLLRSDISEFASSGLSLMPEGMEKALKPADMADLIAWLRMK